MKTSFLILLSINFYNGQINLESTGVSEKVKCFVGSTFRHELQFYKHEEATADRKELQLLTVEENELFENSWVLLDVGEKVIYGFPLAGNEGTSTFIVKSTTYTNIGEKKSRLKINIFVKETFEKYFHEVKLCTTLTLDLFLKNLDIRYELAEMLSFYLLKTHADNFVLKKYNDGCIWFSFKNIEDGASCNFDRIDLLQRQIFINDEISKDFSKSIEHVTTVKSVNLTLSGPCIRKVVTKKKKNLHWLKTVAPILILLAIVGIPVSISCYVCRGVRRRQNKMRQQQDKLAREDQIRLSEQMQEYKDACGLDDIEESDSSDIQNQVKWKKESKDEKSVFLARLFEQYMPQSIQDKFDIGKSVLDYTKQKSSQKKLFKRSINPVSRMLDIRSPTIVAAQARAAESMHTKSRVPTRNMITNFNQGISSSSALASSNLNLMKKIGCNSSQLSINYKNQGINPQLDSWRRLNSAIAINNSISNTEEFDKELIAKPSNENHRESILRNNSAPAWTGDIYNQIYKNNCTEVCPHYTSNPQIANNSSMYTSNVQIPCNSTFTENNRGKSVSFYNVSDFDDDLSDYRRIQNNEKITSRSCNDVAHTNHDYAENFLMDNNNRRKKSIQDQTWSGNGSITFRIDSTRRTSMLGSMINLATNSKQKLKSSIKNGSILKPKTRDVATSPFQPDKKAFRKRSRLKCSNNSLYREQSKPCLRKRNSCSQIQCSPRDTFIPDIESPTYSSLYKTNEVDEYNNNNKANHFFEDEILSNSEDAPPSYFYHNYLFDEFDNNNYFHSYDNLPLRNDIIKYHPLDNEQKMMTPADTYKNKANKKIFYFPSDAIVFNHDYSNDEHSSITTSNFEQFNYGYPQNAQPSQLSPIPRVKGPLRRQMYQQRSPEMSKSFDKGFYLDSSSTGTPSSEPLHRKSTYLPAFTNDTRVLTNNYDDSQHFQTPDSSSQFFIRNSTSMPNIQKKGYWKSFESGSSEITYVDFGSEYEFKGLPQFPMNRSNLNSASSPITPSQRCMSPAFAKDHQHIFM